MSKKCNVALLACLQQFLSHSSDAYDLLAIRNTTVSGDRTFFVVERSLSARRRSLVRLLRQNNIKETTTGDKALFAPPLCVRPANQGGLHSPRVDLWICSIHFRKAFLSRVGWSGVSSGVSWFSGLARLTDVLSRLLHSVLMPVGDFSYAETLASVRLVYSLRTCSDTFTIRRSCGLQRQDGASQITAVEFPLRAGPKGVRR